MKSAANASSRRRFLIAVGVGSAAAVVDGACRPYVRATHAEGAENSGAGGPSGSDPGPPLGGMTAPEALMREHGVIDRLLLVYAECRHRLANALIFDPGLLNDAARVMQAFVHGYHERLEEQYVFSMFKTSGSNLELVALLETQHERGRAITESLLDYTGPSTTFEPMPVTRMLDEFVRMYRPHVAREDTVLFPALRRIASDRTVAELGARFATLERQRFGSSGFDDMVTRVAGLEDTLGIHDLSQYTAPAVSELKRMR